VAGEREEEINREREERNGGRVERGKEDSGGRESRERKEEGTKKEVDDVRLEWSNVQ
jgi:hypothetical protein